MRRLKSNKFAPLPTDLDALVKMHPPLAIHDEVGYRKTQEIIDRLTSVPRLSPGQAAYLDTISILFEAYENEHHDIDVSVLDPIDALKSLMIEQNMSASDLGRVLGNRELGSKVLRRERALSKSHIAALSRHFHVSPALFFSVDDH